MRISDWSSDVCSSDLRSFPSIEDLEPADIEDFGLHSVLLDFTAGMENPAVAYMGSALRRECDIEGEIHYINDVPSRSLLSRLTDHYLQIIANSAPIGFEAEFRSEEHTSELQSLMRTSYAVFCLKNKKISYNT